MNPQNPDLKIEMVEIGKLRPFERNPRDHSNSTPALINSIKHFGFVDPVIVRRSDFRIIAGHNRVKAMKELGQEKIPCVLIDIEDKEVDALSIAHNRVGELSEWSLPELKDILLDLDSLNVPLELTAFSEKSVEFLMNQVHLTEEEKAQKKKIICPKCNYEFSK